MTPEEKAAHDALINQMKDTARTEIEQRGYQNAGADEAAIAKHLEGMDLEGLRAMKPAEMQTSINKIAGQLEKIEQRSSLIADIKTNALMEAMAKPAPGETQSQWEKVEMAMRSKGTGLKGVDIVNINVRAAAIMTVANTIDEATNTIPSTLIESMSMADFVPKRRGDQFIYDIADRTVVQEITQYKTWLEEGSEQGSFAIVAEGGLKPLVSTALVRNFATAKKIAGKYVVTEEFVKFRREAFTIIRRLINDKMLRDYAALLVTDLNAQAAGYVGTSLDDTIVAPTDYDAIGAVAAQEETLNFNPDVLILHPQDKWRLALDKDSQGRYYMMVPMMGADGITRLMSFRVVTSTYQTIGFFTLGESGLFKIEEEPITVRMGYGIEYTVTGGNVTAVSSDFDTNRLRIIVETYFLDWIATNNLGSFVRASFATVKAALLKP